MQTKWKTGRQKLFNIKVQASHEETYKTQTEGLSTNQKGRNTEVTRNKSLKRRHLCAAPALLPVLLLQLHVLHSQLEAGQLGHERLVTHMERVRDGELEVVKEEWWRGLKMRCKFRRRGQKVNAEGELMEERREVIGGGRGGKKHHKHGESNSNLTSYKRTNKKMLLGKKCAFLYLINLLYPTGPSV